MEIRQHAATDRGREPHGSGAYKVAGDWKETMSTHWFQTVQSAQNVYKGRRGMFNIYSA